MPPEYSCPGWLEGAEGPGTALNCVAGLAEPKGGAECDGGGPTGVNPLIWALGDGGMGSATPFGRG